MTGPEVDPVPDGTLLLHIGPQKTGSTALQEALHNSRDRLAELGVLYPGPHRRPIEAGWAVLGQGAPLGRPAPRIGTWEKVVRQVTDTDLPRICLSNEDLSRGDDAAVDRIVSDLGPERLHVVYVGRRYDGLLPSHWQERLKARMTWPYPKFLEHVLAERSASWEWRLMWESQLPGEVLARWGRHLRPDQFTLVPLEHGNHDFLLRVFEGLLALPEGTLETPTLIHNRSYSFPEAEALRRINQMTVEEKWPDRRYLDLVRRGVAIQWTNSARNPGHASIPRLPAWALDRVADLADAQVEAFSSSGARIVGDVEELRVRGRVSAYDGPLELADVPLELLAQAMSATAERTRVLRVAREQRAARPPAPPPSLSVRVRRLAGRLRRRLTRR